MELKLARLGAARPQTPVFLVAPHRMMFFSGAIQTLAAFAWWAWLLAARSGLFAMPELPWPAPWLHGAFAIYGVFPFFVFGFLMTAMPRWQGTGDVGGVTYVGTWTLLTAGWVLFYCGMLWPALLLPGLCLVLTGWLGGVVVLGEVALAPSNDRRHALFACCALLAGVPGLACLIAYAGWGWTDGPRVAEAIGIWACLAPLFILVCHRMVPFFSSNVIPKYVMVRPYWALYAMIGTSLLHMALTIARLPQWVWLPDAALAGVASWLSWNWQLRESFRARLLAMLHIAFIWLPAAMWLSALQSLLLLNGHAVLGLAPLHALSIGFFAAMLLSMVSRVTFGHSGRPLQADAATWYLFLALQTVALIRVAAEFSAVAYNALVIVAVVGWLAVFGFWCIKMVPIYLRPRSDGRPG